MTFESYTSSPSSPVIVVLNTTMISKKKLTSIMEFNTLQGRAYIHAGLKQISMGREMPLYRAHAIIYKSHKKWMVLLGASSSFLLRLTSITGLLSLVAASRLTLLSLSSILANWFRFFVASSDEASFSLKPEY